ncbi:MAG: T9SS type A sorting domain-containing protein [Ignavibacteria bacterium]|nr:T9SS type A sorting domain-containing protein [Ignavibacteria bacterium]
MYKKAFISCITFILLFISDLYPQYSELHSAGATPWVSNENFYKNPLVPNPNSVGYAYYMTPTGGCQLFRFNIGSPNVTTLIGSEQQIVLGNGDFANPTGIWKYYVQSNISSPFTIYEVDTATGIMTSVGNPNNLRTGHKIRDMEWDHTTNKMFFVSTNYDNTETQFYSMDWATKTLMWIGPLVTSPGGIMAGGFNANGTYFGCDMGTDALWKVNKYTGAWTEVGPLGISVCLYQDAAFDRSDFSKMLLTSCTDTIGLFQVDTATGSASSIGNFPASHVSPVSFCVVPKPGPQISHTPLQNTVNVAGPYAVNAVIITAGSNISSTKLYWSRNNTAITDSVSMTNTSGNNWTGNIPGNGLPSTYRYYIWTKDLLNRYVTAPYNAPVSLYSFMTNSNDTVKPVINHTPLGNIPKYQWPDSIIASVTDNIGIDSVWVSWRINSNAAKHLKLINTIGSIYKGLFNSLNSEINVGDTIHYRLIAQDNFNNHNRDSTALISFIIIPSEYSCIGTGTLNIGAGGPFFNFFQGYKNQILWTASEIASNGGSRGNILRVGFYVLSVDDHPMNNFNINIQNTQQTVLLNGLITTGWSNTYSGTYTVKGTGWQFIDLQTPFYWDGVSNLLFEFCFGNTSYNTGTRVRGTAATSMNYYTYFEDTLGLACNSVRTPWGETSRPNICLSISPPIGIGNNTNNSPAAYRLSQNFPNPFNPVTKINYEILKKGFVSLKIYDILGRMVKELVSDIKSPGSYSVDYDASGLSSGIYLYKLECDGYAETRRMILIK